MDLQAYIDELRLNVSGGLLEIEIDDSTIRQILRTSLREIERYIDTTKIITIPYESCIDMSTHKVNAVARIYRAKGYLMSDPEGSEEASADPMYMAQWQMLSGNGNMYNINDWAYSFASWNTALQVRNTMSTDLVFRFDKDSDKLYINCPFDIPEKITVEYIPKFDCVEDIKSAFWIDILLQLATARTKIILGRIRSRYTQSNALWQQDGAEILAEGNSELAALRERLNASTQLSYPID